MDSIFMVAVLSAALLILISVIARLQNGTKTLNRQYIADSWKEITEMARASTKSAQHAVIEADKLLDYVLRKRAFKGETMGERLKSAQKVLSNNNNVWQAHKLRNQLVHEAESKIAPGQVKQALLGFRQALKDLKAL